MPLEAEAVVDGLAVIAEMALKIGQFVHQLPAQRRDHSRH